jgi:hypothetical protein
MPPIRREVWRRRIDGSSEITSQVQARPAARSGLIEMRLECLADDFRPVASALSRDERKPVCQCLGHLYGHCFHGITILTEW